MRRQAQVPERTQSKYSIRESHAQNDKEKEGFLRIEEQKLTLNKICTVCLLIQII